MRKRDSYRGCCCIDAAVSFIPGIIARARCIGTSAAVRLLSILAFVFTIVLIAEQALGARIGLLDVVLFGLGALCWVMGLIWSVAAPAAAARPVRSDKHRSQAGTVRARSLNYEAALALGEGTELDLGQAHFIIRGVDRATRMDTTWRVTADNEANARAKGELEGILVTSVEQE
jgi:hypothetical protein